MFDIQAIFVGEWVFSMALSLAFQAVLGQQIPTRNMPPQLPQPPGKAAPEDLNALGNARQRAVLLTSQAIREGLIKRFDPNFIYMREFPERNPNFRREVLNRAIFESLPFSHGDQGVIREVLAELKARGYPWIDLSLADSDIDWIVGEKTNWLGLLINQLSAAQLDQNVPIKLENYPLPQAIWITTGTGLHPAFMTFTSSNLPKLQDEIRFLNGNLQRFDLSTQSVSNALRSTLENPPESELRDRLRRGEVLKAEFFYARLWEAVFINMDRIQGDKTLLSNALEDLSEDYPDVVKAKPGILNDLSNIKRQRVAWFDNFVLPRLWRVEHPQPSQPPMASGQNMPTVTIQLPRNAWILRDPGPENIPEMTFGDFTLQKAENDLLRVLP